MDTELHSVPLLVTIINFTFDSKCEIYFEYMKIYFSVVLLQHFVLLRFKRKRKKKSYSSCNQNTLLHLLDSRKRKTSLPFCSVLHSRTIIQSST